MKTLYILMLVCVVNLLSGAVSAEIYKYVDADGKVHFTDVPPAGVAAVQMDIQPNVYEGGSKSRPSAAKPPAAVTPATGRGDAGRNGQQQAQQPKVELFVTSWCGYCKQAEAYLRAKGVAFTTYDIEKDLRAARRKDSLTSNRGVPFALIGDQKLTGFSEQAYARALQQARH